MKCPSRGQVIFESFKPCGLGCNIFKVRHSTSLNWQKIQNSGGHGKTQDSSQRESSYEYSSLYNYFNAHNPLRIEDRCHDA